MVRTAIWEQSTVRGTLAAGRAKLLERIGRAMPPETCAAAIVRGITSNRAVIPVTVEAHVAWRLARLSPALAATISHRLAA